MKLNLTEKWYDSEVVGDDAASITAGSASSQRLCGVELAFPAGDIPSLSLGRLINLSRRFHEFTLGELANRSGVEPDQLYAIEHESNPLPQPATVHKVATPLGLSGSKLCDMYLMTPSAGGQISEKHAAYVALCDPSDSPVKLSREESDMLHKFVAYLHGS